MRILIAISEAVGGRKMGELAASLFSGYETTVVEDLSEDPRALEDATLYTTHPSMFPPGPQREAYERLSSAVRLQRYGGDCYSYGLLALGQIDLVVEAGLQPYDIVPLTPIVESAGGVVSGARGEPATAGGTVIAAANQGLHDHALRWASEEGIR